MNIYFENVEIWWKKSHTEMLKHTGSKEKHTTQKPDTALHMSDWKTQKADKSSVAECEQIGTSCSVVRMWTVELFGELASLDILNWRYFVN